MLRFAFPLTVALGVAAAWQPQPALIKPRFSAVRASGEESSEGKVIDFDMKPPEGEELDKLMYVLGINLAKQLPADLKQLLSPAELETCLTGVTDMMLDRAEDPAGQLQTYGDRLNVLLQERAAVLVEKAKEAGLKVLQEAAEVDGAETTTNGVVIQHESKGVGMYPTSSSTVEVHYKGQLVDGTVFDSSYARGEPVKFPLNGVIEGWKEALQQMQEGGKARLVIPSELGYGASGAPQAGIPGGAVLIFEVELIKVLSGGVGGLVL